MKNKSIIWILILIFLFSSIIPITHSYNTSSNNIIYVDDDNTNGPWDGSIENPYRTIYDGINASSEGDTVFVLSGSYQDFEILVNHSINLIGEDKSTTIIEEGQIILLRGKESIVCGFNLNKCNVVSEYQDYVEIFDNIIVGGVYIDGSLEAYIHHNDISYSILDSQAAGVRVDGDSSVLIEYNVISNSSIGIRFWADNGKILNNVIKDNEAGLFIYGNNNLISNNYIINNNGNDDNGYGIYISWNNNIVKNNHIADNRYGVRIVAESGNVFEMNNFIDNFKHVHITGSFRVKNNEWDKNYWSGSISRGLFPKILFGMEFTMVPIPGPGDLIFWIPWIYIEIEFDMNPVKEPYDIPYPEVNIE